MAVFLKQFSLLFPAHRLSVPAGTSLDAFQSLLISNIIHSDHFTRYPPSKQYQRSFWKWCIQYLEHQDADIDAEIYNKYLANLPQSESSLEISVPSPSYITHFWKLGGHKPDEISQLDTLETTTLLESRTTIESGTTGLKTWLASITLAEHLIRHQELVQNKVVLELGAGAGFLGVIIATLQVLSSGSSTLWLTDLKDEVLNRCKQNIMLPCNRSSSHPMLHYHLLDWESSLEPGSGMPTFLTQTVNADLVVGADLVFDPALIPALIETIRLSLQRGETFNKFLTHAQVHLIVAELPEIQLVDFMVDDPDVTASNIVKIMSISLR